MTWQTCTTASCIAVNTQPTYSTVLGCVMPLGVKRPDGLPNALWPSGGAALRSALSFDLRIRRSIIKVVAAPTERRGTKT
jgi:hypothetical protein